MSWIGWDMNHLTEIERVRRIELLGSLVIYYIAGEQLYLPFYNETNKKKAREMQLTKVSAARVHLTDRIAAQALLRHQSFDRDAHEAQ